MVLTCPEVNRKEGEGERARTILYFPGVGPQQIAQRNPSGSPGLLPAGDSGRILGLEADGYHQSRRCLLRKSGARPQKPLPHRLHHAHPRSRPDLLFRHPGRCGRCRGLAYVHAGLDPQRSHCRQCSSHRPIPAWLSGKCEKLPGGRPGHSPGHHPLRPVVRQPLWRLVGHVRGLLPASRGCGIRSHQRRPPGHAAAVGNRRPLPPRRLLHPPQG